VGGLAVGSTPALTKKIKKILFLQKKFKKISKKKNKKNKILKINIF
jgi:hypothetical protein